MANIHSFKIDTSKIKAGERVKMDEGFTLIVRGFTDDFIDAQSRLMRKEAKHYRGDTSQIPFHRMREINAQLMADYLLVGVEGLYSDVAETTPITLEDFKKMLADPDYKPLLDSCWEAAVRVNNGYKEDEEEAVGN